MVRIIPLCLLLSLFSCASTTNLQSWPDFLPEQEYFEEVYSSDGKNKSLQTEVEYLNWVVDFYQGTLLYPQGWQTLSADVLTMSSSAHQAKIVPQLDEAGRLIGAEWARDNSIRRVDNRLLSLWGSVIQVTDSEQKRSQAIDLIISDVKELTAETIATGDITENRYNSLLQIDVFGGFPLFP